MYNLFSLLLNIQSHLTWYKYDSLNEKYPPINSYVWIKCPVCSAVGRGHPRCSLEGRSTLLEEAFVSLLPCPSARLISTSCLSLNVISHLLAQAAYSNDSPAMMDSPSGYHKLLSYKLLFVTVFYHHSRKVPDTMTNGVVYTLHLPWGRHFGCFLHLCKMHTSIYYKLEVPRLCSSFTKWCCINK